MPIESGHIKTGEERTNKCLPGQHEESTCASALKHSMAAFSL
jgi:hypothetical protein